MPETNDYFTSRGASLDGFKALTKTTTHWCYDNDGNATAFVVEEIELKYNDPAAYKAPEETKVKETKPSRLRVRRRAGTLNERVIEAEVERRLKTATAQIMQDARRESYQEGWDKGHAEGRRQGALDAAEDEYNRGHVAGYQQARVEIAGDEVERDAHSIYTIRGRRIAGVAAVDNDMSVYNMTAFVAACSDRGFEHTVHGTGLKLDFQWGANNDKVFTLNILRVNSAGTVVEIEISCNFTTDRIMGAAQLIEMVADLGKRALPYVDGWVLVNFLCDYLCKPKTHDEDTPRIFVPETARPKAQELLCERLNVKMYGALVDGTWT